MLKLDGVLVLYNPEETVLENINSYKEYVDHLYVVDNSDRKNHILIENVKKIDNVVYIDNNDNLGIANALNVGARKAIDHGAEWLLTMDQDSHFKKNSLQGLIESLSVLSYPFEVGVFSPLHKLANTVISSESTASQIVEVDSVMTSGNIINLKIFETVGGFLDKYFIDSVDHEYCLRLKKKGFKVLLHKGCYLEHNLGNIDYSTMLGRKIYYTNHSPIRRYYITRNRLDLISCYAIHFPCFCFREFYNLFAEWGKIILFEKHKIKKSAYFMKGVFDFIFRRFGKISL